MSREKISVVLSNYLPSMAVDVCASWIIQKNIHLKITRGRASKFGDYRPLSQGKGHRISVNHDLNPYSFLITFVHEVAHLETFNKFKNYHEPHGKEWKIEFRLLLSDFMINGVFPDDIKAALSNYIHNPAASSCSDHNLFRTLKTYDKRSSEIVHLEDLPENTVFRLHQSRQGLIFKKGHKIRSRFHCIEVNSNKIYFVSPVAEVRLISGLEN
jgi:SprT protein